MLLPVLKALPFGAMHWKEEILNKQAICSAGMIYLLYHFAAEDFLPINMRAKESWPLMITGKQLKKPLNWAQQ